MAITSQHPSDLTREKHKGQRCSTCFYRVLSSLTTFGLFVFASMAQGQQFTPVYTTPEVTKKTIYFETTPAPEVPPRPVPAKKSIEFDIPPTAPASGPPMVLPQPASPVPNYATPPVAPTQPNFHQQSRPSLPSQSPQRGPDINRIYTQGQQPNRVPPRPRTLDDIGPVPIPNRSTDPSYPIGGGLPTPRKSRLRTDLYPGKKNTPRAGILTRRDFPGAEELFRLESERTFKRRLEQEARDNNDLKPLQYPEDPVVSTEAYKPRQFPPRKKLVEPSYVCYGRPYFEQLNFDRYGWDVGAATPVLQFGKFCWDVFFLPYHAGTQPFRHYECNAGYGLPGDPVPFYIYPPRLSVSGTLAQGIAWGSGYAIFQ